MIDLNIFEMFPFLSIGHCTGQNTCVLDLFNRICLFFTVVLLFTSLVISIFLKSCIFILSVILLVISCDPDPLESLCFLFIGWFLVALLVILIFLKGRIFLSRPGHPLLYWKNPWSKVYFHWLDRGHDMMHRSVLIIYDQQFFIPWSPLIMHDMMHDHWWSLLWSTVFHSNNHRWPSMIS